MERVKSHEYWEEVEALARQAKEEEANGYDPTDIVHELVDSHTWAIYYFHCAMIMDYTDNENALFEIGGLDARDNWRDVLQSFAFWAFRADIMDKLAELEEK